MNEFYFVHFLIFYIIIHGIFLQHKTHNNNKRYIGGFIINQELAKELGFEQDIHPLFLSIEDDKVMNPEEISSMLNVHAESVRRWCRNGKLPSYNFGGKYVIMGDEFKKFVKDSRIQPKWQREFH